MKSFVSIIMFSLLGYPGLSQTEKINDSPLGVINQRMGFYNQHNFEYFIQLYSDSVKVYTYPDKFLASGKYNLASLFKPKFAAKSIEVKIITQFDKGNNGIN